jgi:hypothetical protein
MKPFIIASFGGGPQFNKKWLVPHESFNRFKSRYELGDVEGFGASSKEWDFPFFVNALASTGFSPQKRLYYSSFDFTFVNQSVSWHKDDGCGILVATLVAQSKSEDRCVGSRHALITKHGELPLQLGDMFVFNASLHHAWISYEACVLACITVKRKRK